MNPPALTAVRAGLSRGWIEFRQSVTTRDDLVSHGGLALVFTVVALFMRSQNVDGTGVPIASMWMAGMMGLVVATQGLMGVAQTLTAEREDGTLLRAKAIPDGTVGYLVGKAVHITLVTASLVAVLLVVALLLMDGFRVGGPAAWATLAWVLILGLMAMAPLGAIAGSLISNPRVVMTVLMVPFMAMMGVSGVFYQVSGFPEWLQWIAQATPLYWIALGMRSAFLPDSMLAVEIAQSWRLDQAALVLGAWAVVGFLAAVPVLRRMARRESGSRVEAGRRRAMQRG
ncbi:ABC transporter permease [Streptomonospora salina]|uniref:Transport permease protein n=1 Tax=Streptomonospora salina TaxID=104205 RepID=A0A841ED19_9ACTN|nr:ABC transporter permease [Streptomonospora salina]MBB6001022.1 ABC-2 type transport system permease protein [Streptomonospora salina]